MSESFSKLRMQSLLCQGECFALLHSGSSGQQPGLSLHGFEDIEKAVGAGRGKAGLEAGLMATNTPGPSPLSPSINREKKSPLYPSPMPD